MHHWKTMKALRDRFYIAEKIGSHMKDNFQNADKMMSTGEAQLHVKGDVPGITVLPEGLQWALLLKFSVICFDLLPLLYDQSPLPTRANRV